MVTHTSHIAECFCSALRYNKQIRVFAWQPRSYLIGGDVISQTNNELMMTLNENKQKTLFSCMDGMRCVQQNEQFSFSARALVDDMLDANKVCVHCALSCCSIIFGCFSVCVWLC